MSNLTKLEFVALDITVNNYLSWILDAEIYLGGVWFVINLIMDCNFHYS